MKKVVKILGVGSARDRELLRSVQTAANEVGLNIDIQFISDINAFLHLGITGIPSMLIEDKIVANGRIPGVPELKNLLQSKAADGGSR